MRMMVTGDSLLKLKGGLKSNTLSCCFSEWRELFESQSKIEESKRKQQKKKTAAECLNSSIISFDCCQHFSLLIRQSSQFCDLYIRHIPFVGLTDLGVTYSSHAIAHAFNNVLSTDCFIGRLKITERKKNRTNRWTIARAARKPRKKCI